MGDVESGERDGSRDSRAGAQCASGFRSAVLCGRVIALLSPQAAIQSDTLHGRMQTHPVTTMSLLLMTCGCPARLHAVTIKLDLAGGNVELDETTGKRLPNR